MCGLIRVFSLYHNAYHAIDHITQATHNDSIIDRIHQCNILPCAITNPTRNANESHGNIPPNGIKFSTKQILKIHHKPRVFMINNGLI